MDTVTYRSLGQTCNSKTTTYQTAQQFCNKKMVDTQSSKLMTHTACYIQ